MAPSLIPSMPTLLSLLPSLTPRRLHPSLRSFLIGCLRMGPLPLHIGFVMDGNRRYSRRLGVAVKEGHSQGFEALKRVRPVSRA